MTSGWTQKDKIDHDKKADNHGPEQQPLLFRHQPLPGLYPNYALSNSSAVGPAVT